MVTRASPPSAAALMVLLRFVRPLFRQLTQAIERELDGAGISLPTRGVLERLYEVGPQPVPALARALELPRQYVQALVDAVEAAGLVERRPNPAHRRSPLIALTEDGRGATEAMLAREMVLLDRIARGFDADEVEVAARVLGDLVTAFQAVSPAEGVTAPAPAAPRTRPTDSR